MQIYWGVCHPLFLKSSFQNILSKEKTDSISLNNGAYSYVKFSDEKNKLLAMHNALEVFELVAFDDWEKALTQLHSKK